MNLIPQPEDFDNGGAPGDAIYYLPGLPSVIGPWPWRGRCAVLDLSMPVAWTRYEALKAAGSREIPRRGTLQTRNDSIAYIERRLPALLAAAGEHVTYSVGVHEGRIIEPGDRLGEDGRGGSLVAVRVPDAAAEGSLAEDCFTHTLSAMLTAAEGWRAPFTVEAWGAFHASTFRAPTDGARRASVICGPVYRDGLSSGAAQPALYAPRALELLLRRADRVLIRTLGTPFGPGEDWRPSPEDFIVKIYAQPWCVEEWGRVVREHAPRAVVTYRISEAAPMRPRVHSTSGWRTAAEADANAWAALELAQQQHDDVVRAVWEELIGDGFEIKPRARR